MRLLLVRHGITTYNISELYTGQTDAPLTELGVRQSEAAATYLATEKLDVIVSSDLQRARNTALVIAQSHNLPVLEDPELREIGMGAWEGFTPAQIQARNFAEWTHVRSDPITLAPPGGESFAQLSERARSVLERYQTAYAGKTALWASHTVFIEVALCAALKLDLRYRHCFVQDNASISELLFGDELPHIKRFNDTAHLRFMNDGSLFSAADLAHFW